MSVAFDLPSPVRSMGEGARRAGEGPSGARDWLSPVLRTGPHPAFGHLLPPAAGEGALLEIPA